MAGLATMQPHVETLGALQRRIDLSLAAAEVEREINARLLDLARKVKMSGFRPGKVPLKMVASSYGAQVQAEVLNDKVGAAFNQAISANGLRVAGLPKLEPKSGQDEASLAFSATFEIYPDVKVGDLSSNEVQRAHCTVGEDEVVQTLNIMRKQRATFEQVADAARDGDRITVDFAGRVDGLPFDGGAAQGFVFPLGEGRMLPEFEQALRGLEAGAHASFNLTFPSDYRATSLAGKEASFEVDLKQVERPLLPPVDTAFAKALGVADGDIAKMNSEIRANLEREVSRRVRARSKENVMQALLNATSFDVPRALVDSEAKRLSDAAISDMASRGMQVKDAPVPIDLFLPQAERRVRLGLILAEIVRSQGLQAKQDQIRRTIEEIAQSYERPAEVIQWYLTHRERVAEIETVVIEENVVQWVLSKVKVVEINVPFDELMGRTN